MEFGPLKVSTMTWTAAVAGTLDLDAVFQTVALDDGAARPGLVGLIDKDRAASRPPGLTLGKKFGSNVTMHVLMDAADKRINVKVFKNGCIQLTGAKTCADGTTVCNLVASRLCGGGLIADASYFDLRVRMINSDLRADSGIRRAYLYERWRADPAGCIVFDPLTYPALKVLLFYDGSRPLAEQDGVCRCSKHCSTKKNAKYRRCVKVTVALFESGCIIITGSILPEDAQRVRTTIIAKLRAEGAAAFIVKEDPRVVMRRMVERFRATRLKDADPLL
jgi:TATA-box binding protein (TBP) (component of TFIID and TFIIIB)